MGKKLHYSFLLIAILFPLFMMGQCPTSVTISPDTGNTICDGTSVTFTATTNGGNAPFTYQWKINGSNTGTASTSNTFTTTTLSNGEKVSVQVVDASGTTCSVTSSNVTMTVNPNRTPTVNISASTNNICPGDNVTFTATPGYGGDSPQYSWYINSSSTASQTGNSNTFSTTALGVGTNTVRVVMTSNFNCLSTSTAEATSNQITVRPGTPNQPGAISGTANLCPGTTQTFSISNVPDATSYVWTLPSGWTGSSNTNSINVTVGSATGTISVAAKNDCGTSGQESLTVNIKPGTPSQPGTISGKSSFCPGTTQTYTIADVADATSYNWTLPSGWTGTSTSSSINVTSGTTGGTISVSATNECGTSSVRNLSVSVQHGTPATPNSITGETAVCPGVTGTYSIPAVSNATSYNWILPSGWSGTSSTNSINITSGTSDGTIYVEAVNSCGTSAQQSLAITVKAGTPAQPGTISGNTAVCPSRSETYSIDAVANASSYVWTLPNGWTGTSATNSITVNTANSGSGNITVKAVNDCGISSERSLAVSVSPPAPTTPGTITGNTEVCATATGLTYSVAAINNATQYNWSLPTGWTITSADQNARSITVSASANSGNITVSAQNSCGTSGESTLSVSSVNGAPANPGTITSSLPAGNNAICPPYTMTFSVAATGTYKWTVPTGWDITSGAGTNSITVKVTSAATSGTKSVSVVGTNICGDSSSSTYTGIEVNNHITADFGADQTICKSQNSIILNGSRSFGNANLDITFTTSGSGSFTNKPSGSNKNGPFSVTYNPSAADKVAGQVTLTMTVPEPNGNSNNGNKCGIASDSMILYFTPDATISDPANKNAQVCINTNLSNIQFAIGGGATGATITGLPAGLSGNYSSGTFIISGTPTVTGSFPYTVTTTGNCSSQQVTRSGTITVIDNDKITDASNKDQEICINSSISNMVFGTNTPITSITATGLPAGLSGNLNGGKYTISGTATEAGEFNYTLTSVGTCTSTSTSGTIVVNPDVTITTTSDVDQEVCINTAIENIEYSITEPGTGANISGLPAGINASFNNGTYVLSGSPTEAGTFNYTITTEGDCQQAEANGTIMVNPDPTAEISYDGEFCESQTGSYSPTLTGTGAFENGTYSAPAGLSINATSGVITPSASDPGTYIVTYSQPNSCAGATAETEITINATPYVEIIYQDPLCNNDGSPYLPTFENGVGNYENGTFSAQPAGLDIDSSTGEIAPQTSDPAEYTISYTIASANSCNEVIVATSLTITRNPQVTTFEYPAFVCTSETTPIAVNIEGEGNYTGGTFTGTAGLTIDANGNIDASTSSPGTHTINYTIDASDGCGEVIASTDIDINEQVSILTEPQNVGICSSQPAQFEVSASGDELTYQWYRLVNGNPQALAGEDEAIFSLSNATSVDAGDYYVVVSGADGCSEVTSETVTLNVDENIVIIKPTEDLTICETDYTEITFEFIAHASGAPLSFQWIKDGNPISDDGVNYSMAVSDPAGANGEYTGTLTVLDIEENDSGVYAVQIDGPDYFTCSQAVSKNFTFRVNPIPSNPETTDVTYCLNDTAVNLSVDNPDSDYEYAWYSYDSGTDEYTYLGDTYKPDTSTPTTIEYYVTQKLNATGCESGFEKLTVIIEDKPEPVSEETIRFEYCFEEEISSPIEITPAENATLNWYLEDGETPTATPTPNTSEVTTTIYYVSQTYDTGCESDLTKVELNIKSLPDLSAGIAEGYSSPVCNGNTIELIASGAESYVWTLDGEIVGTDAELAIVTDTPGDFTYIVEGTSNGCSTTFEVPIVVDEVAVAGTLSGPENVCINAASGTLSLSGQLGEVIRWESKPASADVSAWTLIDSEIASERNFSGLTQNTDFRVIIQNGSCSEEAAEFTVNVDQLPDGGSLAWPNDDRIFLTCEVQSNDLNETLTLSDYTGQIAGWEYRTASNLSWTSYDSQSATLTSSDFQNMLGNTVQSTVFRAKIVNGSCTDGTYSATAILSVIPSDIKPSPVQVNPEVLCYGNDITLSSETGYGAEYGQFDGGAFDNAGIKNHGWNFTNPGGGSNDFDSGANNGRADHWLRMNPHGSNPQENEKVYTANLTPEANQSPTNGTMVNFRTFSTNAGNKGFALVTGNNDSNMETPVFSLGSLDEAILTFDQAYNLTKGAKIYVEISTNGGSSYSEVLFEMTGTATSGNYNNFGDGTPQTRPLNKMVIDLGDYLGQSNLRIRFRFDGQIDGDVWAVDNIVVPEGPQDVLLQWFYDEDATDPDNTLEQIGADNQEVVSFTPRKIGWNDFEVKTALLLDSNGDPCESINNSETVRVFVFDQYTTDVTAVTGECGSTRIELTASTSGAFQGVITEYPTLDGYTGAWVITGSSDYTLTNDDENVDAVNDPNAVFEAEELGDFTFEWVLTPTAKDENDILIENTGCPPIINPAEVSLPDCTTLDFDGINDYVDLGTNYAGNYTIEFWIRPEESTGTIISGANFEIKMSDLPSNITTNDRWYHIAVTGGDVYVDGIKSGTIGNAVGGSKTLIGARWNSSTKVPENYYSGWIDELRIWNKPLSEKDIRFMMNQRLDLNSKGSGQAVEGEIVPNKTINGSYLTSNGFNLDQDGDYFYNRSWDDLAGYYRLISAEPDPLNLVVFDDGLKPANGTTPDLALTAIDGILKNMTTHQQNTSPVPYFSGNDGDWSSRSTWARPDVWDYPNSTYNGTPIDWNIARLNHNITSGNKDIIILGLISESNLLTINASHPIRITHYLLLDGNMDLVEESQLLQDHGSILDNSSSGWLQRDQQGRRSSYNYNYWTSPVSDQGTDNNSGYIIKNVMLDGQGPNPQTINFRYGYYVADGARTNPATISEEWIWDFRGGDADIYGDWVHLGSTELEIVGAGFSMKGSDGTVGLGQMQEYVFQGKPNNGNIELAYLKDKNYLIGNPYPSALDYEEFLKDNSKDAPGGRNSKNVFNGVFYFWDHFANQTHILKEYIGGYAVHTLSGGIEAASIDDRINNTNGKGSKKPQQFVPIGQGFFINSSTDAAMENAGVNIDGGTIVFKNTQRIYVPEGTNSVFLQQENRTKGQRVTEDNRLKIRLKFESPAGYYRQILVTEDQNASNDFDLGYDAPLIENNAEDMYWLVNDEPYVIQGVGNFEKEQVLPLGFKTKEGGLLTVKIDSTENWPSNKELYLKDKIKDSLHDILKSAYTIKIDEPGEIKDRFELVFFKPEAEVPDLEPELPIIDNLVGVSYSHFSRQLKIDNFDNLEVDKVMIFDLGGKLLKEYDGLPDDKEILLSLPPVQSGIYIVKVFCENAACNKKIIVK